MVSYVLLIVIAIGLSIAVLAYLTGLIPKWQKPECKEDIQLIMENYTCEYNVNGSSPLIVNVYNKGLFKTNMVYLRLRAPDKRVGMNIQTENFLNGLLPGDSKQIVVAPSKFSTIITHSGDYVLEIEPAAVTEKGKIAMCEKAVITQTISC